jgi:hypothetical protein
VEDLNPLRQSNFSTARISPRMPLLDQIEQRQLVALVPVRVGDDEPQVGVDHALLGLEISLLDAFGELDLLVGPSAGDSGAH